MVVSRFVFPGDSGETRKEVYEDQRQISPSGRGIVPQKKGRGSDSFIHGNVIVEELQQTL
jgi:hypothetical protein